MIKYVFVHTNNMCFLNKKIEDFLYEEKFENDNIKTIGEFIEFCKIDINGDPYGVYTKIYEAFDVTKENKKTFLSISTFIESVIFIKYYESMKSIAGQRQMIITAIWDIFSPNNLPLKHNSFACFSILTPERVMDACLNLINSDVYVMTSITLFASCQYIKEYSTAENLTTLIKYAIDFRETNYKSSGEFNVNAVLKYYLENREKFDRVIDSTFMMLIEYNEIDCMVKDKHEMIFRIEDSTPSNDIVIDFSNEDAEMIVYEEKLIYDEYYSRKVIYSETIKHSCCLGKSSNYI